MSRDGQKSRSARLSDRASWCVVAGIALWCAAAVTAEVPPPSDGGPQPVQRGMDEIQAIPVRPAPCPACGYLVEIPLVDTLMRKRPGDASPPSWRMHAGRRDADTCPYPGPNKVDFQADIVICPACGFAERQEKWDKPLPDEARQWVGATLRPVIREAQLRILGQRGPDMTEEEIRAFFNRQRAIPDSVRTEHYRIFLQAIHAPAFLRARASWLAAWAVRREVAAPPKAPLLAKKALPHAEYLWNRPASGQDLAADIAILETRQKKARQGKNGLPDAEDMAIRTLQAGLWVRLGDLDTAEKILLEVYQECRERFLRTDQDPLWAATNARSPRSQRLNELETLRTDAENEILVRMELVRRERELLAAAAGHLREAFRNGEMETCPDKALFYAYLTAECLRRSGNLPLASEWYREVAVLSGSGTPLTLAAEAQLALAGREAGEKINLLSALGQDGELFEKLRRICEKAAR